MELLVCSQCGGVVRHEIYVENHAWDIYTCLKCHSRKESLRVPPSKVIDMPAVSCSLKQGASEKPDA